MSTWTTVFLMMQTKLVHTELYIWENVYVKMNKIKANYIAEKKTNTNVPKTCIVLQLLNIRMQ